jgi:hypothetical protein
MAVWWYLGINQIKLTCGSIEISLKIRSSILLIWSRFESNVLLGARAQERKLEGNKEDPCMFKRSARRPYGDLIG